MTLTDTDRREAPQPGPRTSHRPAPVPRRAVTADRLATRRTVLAYVAVALGVVPLKGLFSDTLWLFDVWIAMAIVIAPAALLRLRRPATALDIWPGIILLIPYLTARYVHEHAWAGFIPTGATWHDVSLLMTDVHRTTRDEVAPVHTTIAVRLVLCALLALLAALVDLVAVVGRRGALAGVPLLVIYTVAGAVPRDPVAWYWFVFAALGFLILLGIDSANDLDGWGRRIQGRVTRRTRAVMSVATQRIVVVAVAVAVVVPLLVPSQSRNLIANIFHNHSGSVGGFGGTGSGSISPFAVLQGQLTQSSPVSIARVHVSGDGSTQPFYLRLNVLSQYTDSGWQAANHGSTESIDSTTFGGDPPQDGGRTAQMTAQITITGLNQNAPVFMNPEHVQGLSGATTWSAQDDLLLGESVHSGDVITEDFDQPNPTNAQLEAAPDSVPASAAEYLAMPNDFPRQALELERNITRGADSPYQRAVALENYFTDGTHGFVYDLNAPVGDTGSALLDFLHGKRGFCQQYAAAMAILLRAAHVPSRVVLGYMHEPADAQGNFEVTSRDAHAWVEAYFTGIGWVPFDPTPAAGLTAAGTGSDLQWQNGGPGQPKNPIAPNTSDVNRPGATGSGTVTSQAPAPGAQNHKPGHGSQSGGGTSVPWQAIGIALGVLAVLALALVPAFVRWSRRRRRLQSGRHGDAEALWAELLDSAVDLGYVWSAARSPRQVAQWLARDARDSGDALQALATAVERSRYSGGRSGGPALADGAVLADQLRQVLTELSSRRSGRSRLAAVLWPASLIHGRRSGLGVSRARRTVAFGR